MALSNKVYRIKDLRTDTFVSLGYNGKTSWLSFPSTVIKQSKDIINDKNKHHFEVLVFELVPTKRFTIDKEEKL